MEVDLIELIKRVDFSEHADKFKDMLYNKLVYMKARDEIDELSEEEAEEVVAAGTGAMITNVFKWEE